MAYLFTGKLEKVNDYEWRIPKDYMPGMRVCGIIFADEKILKHVINDNALEQVANAAHLPGIVNASMAMPDIHWGYGLSIGGVVATDIENNGVITPGGVGFDINCGVRFLKTNLTEERVRPYLKKLVDALFAKVPAGVGCEGKIKVNFKKEKTILEKGARWAVEKGFGWNDDLEYCEEKGAIKGADVSKVSDRAFERGRGQSGTLGSGNHFLEVQVIDEVYNEEAGRIFGIKKGNVVIMVHTGSRGFGHQICTDYAESMIKLQSKYGIKMPDRQLAAVPVKSPDGEAYLGAMRCAANYAWANRQIITHFIRIVFEEIFKEKAESLGMNLLYDVAHNIAKIENYNINGKDKLLCVHRKGATRAFPPGHSDVPAKYRAIGQPVLIPGDMARCSYLLAGATGAEKSFYSTCHGAGRLLSRSAAIKSARGKSVARELEAKNIIVRCAGKETLAEEMPDAYKDVSDVVNVVQKAGISDKIARMRPIGVIKG